MGAKINNLFEFMQQCVEFKGGRPKIEGLLKASGIRI
jgi:hypothetical protein